MLNRKDIEEWIKSTKDAGYIDCENFDYDEEFNFIISMAEELLKIKEIEFMENTNDEKLFLRIKEKNKQTWLDKDDINFLISFIEKQQRKIQDLEDRNSKCSNISNNTEQSNPSKDIFTKEEIESLKSLVKSIKEKERAMQDMLLFKAKIQTLNEIFRG